MFFRAFTRWFRRGPTHPPQAGEFLRDLARIDTFPILSDTTLRAMSLLNDPDATLADLADLIRRDSVLTVAILKLANSAAYRGHFPTEDVNRATVRLGMRSCQQVIAAVGVRSVFPHHEPQVADACQVLLRHSLFTGTLASKLNAAAQLGFRGEEFTAGLLHDIGRVIVCARAPKVFARVDPLTFYEDSRTLACEREAMGLNHCEIGARFAQANHLPQAVTRVILNHHEPGAEKDHPILVALTATADVLANHVQRERKLTNFQPEQRAEFARLRSLVGNDAATVMRRAMSDVVVEALRETRVMLRITGQ